MIKKNNRKIKFSILSNFENVELIGLSIKSICLSLNLNDSESYDIELSTVEAINNCIEHAYQNNNNKKIEVVLSIYKSKIVIDVSDYGNYNDFFNPVKHDFSPENIDSLPDGGFGIAIIFEIMSDIKYQRKKNKNTLSMTKYFPTKSN